MTRARKEIEVFLRGAVGELIEQSEDDIDVHKSFARLGLDSASALIVTDMLSEWLGIELDATLLYEHETIDLLSAYLALRAAEPGRAPQGDPA